MSRSSKIKSLLQGCLGIYSTMYFTSTSAHESTFSLPIVRDIPPNNVNQRATSQQIGTGFVDSSWYIPVSIGTPPQSFMFLTDSGAPGFSVASVLLPDDEKPKGPIYNVSASTTARQLEGYTYSLAFVGGSSSSGVVYQDVVMIANLSVQNMSIEVQTQNNHNNSDSTASSPRTGNLGLDFAENGQSTKPEQLPTWLMEIMPTLSSAVFTVDFDADTSNGTFDFGHIDTTKYSGNISYSSVNKTFGAGWTIPISGQELFNNTFVPANDWWATIDTGTTGASISRSSADAYFSQVSGASFDTGKGTYTFPCTSKLPDFTFGLGSGRASINGSRLSSSPSRDGKTCTSKLGVSTGDGPYLWGQLFIQELFVVFDWSQGRVGFASKASAPPTGQPSPTSSQTSSNSQQSATASSRSAAASCRRVSLLGIYGISLLLFVVR